VDMAKYRVLFLEEATEHLSEISSALLELEKELVNPGAIDLIFRMAHSIKGMAASLEYDAIAQVSHLLEDRMQDIRSAGRLSGPAELAVLFRGVECIETMVRAVRDGEVPVVDPDIAQVLATTEGDTQASPEAKKKAQILNPALAVARVQNPAD
jgi:two-component system chemotaxis sensor kinase CheA